MNSEVTQQGWSSHTTDYRHYVELKVFLRRNDQDMTRCEVRRRRDFDVKVGRSDLSTCGNNSSVVCITRRRRVSCDPSRSTHGALRRAVTLFIPEHDRVISRLFRRLGENTRKWTIATRVEMQNLATVIIEPITFCSELCRGRES